MTGIVRKLEQAARAARQDSEFAAAVRELPCAILFQVLGLERSDTIVLWGEVRAAGPQDVCLQASPDIWERLAERVPAPGYHSFTAARRHAQGVRVLGADLRVAQALHALERYFELLRGQVEAAPAHLDRSAISGRYANVRVGGQTASLYFEQSGRDDGPVLLLLHTAGADSRQYHALMTDAELGATWRMLAFDMPGHGRSPPLPGQAWIAGGLTRDAYRETCLAFVRQVLRQPAVLLGCSMGAAMALHVAARHPADVAGVVALEAPYRAAGRRTAMLCHPEVNQASHNPAYVRGLMGPTAALSARREAAWIYSQAGFNVYANDLRFYSEDFDAEQHLEGLDARTFGISLLTGAYDYSASPDDTRRVAALIPGARFCEMPELGHFPMLEDPKRLLAYLRPELAHILSVRESA